VVDEVVEGFGLRFLEDVDDIPFRLEYKAGINEVVECGWYQNLVDLFQEGIDLRQQNIHRKIQFGEFVNARRGGHTQPAQSSTNGFAVHVSIPRVDGIPAKHHGDESDAGVTASDECEG